MSAARLIGQAATPAGDKFARGTSESCKIVAGFVAFKFTEGLVATLKTCESQVKTKMKGRVCNFGRR